MGSSLSCPSTNELATQQKVLLFIFIAIACHQYFNIELIIMSQSSSASMQEFRNRVALKFQLYNSLFTALPFHRIEKTGVLLSLFLLDCEEGFNKN